MSTPASPTPLLPRLRVPGYFVLGVALVFPFIDLLLSVTPIRPLTVVWRFGAVGLFSSAVGAPLFVLLLVYALALVLGDRQVMVVVTVVAALIALTLIASVGAFSLDALQMKARVQPQAQSRFVTASAQALGKLLVYGTVATVFAVSSFRTVRGLARRESSRDERPGSLLVGRPGSSRPSAPRAPAAAPRLADGAEAADAPAAAPKSTAE